MLLFKRLSFAFLATLALSACGATSEPRPIDPNSTADFGIHAVLYNTEGIEASVLPERYVLGEDAARHADQMGKPLYIKLPPLIDKSCLETIEAVTNDLNDAALSINLTPDCGKKFGRFTARHVGKRMALTINGKMITAPFLRTAITDGGLLIEGNFETLADAEAIARQFY
ncbi:MAG: hypothetical protein ABJN22_01885 [Litorimonas sp.]